MRKYESAIQTETEEILSKAILGENMILDISTLCSYDMLRELTPEIKGLDTPPYGGMRMKGKKENEKGRKKGEGKI